MNILTDLVPIPCTDRDTLNKLRSLLIEIQAVWLDNLFDSGLTFSTPEIWGKMLEAVCLLERRDNPSAKGIDLKAIASDYDLLEQIFISKRWRYDELGDKVYLDSDSFKGCDLAYLHRFSPTRILESALKLAEEIKAKREKEEEDREFKEALSKIPDGFSYKDYLVEPLATNRSRLFAGLPPINSDRTVEQMAQTAIEEDDRGETEDCGKDG
jgi:hypothetical protein